MVVASKGRRWTVPKRTGRAVMGVAAAVIASFAGIRGTQDAIANGDTRTLSFFHTHTNETGARLNAQSVIDGVKMLKDLKLNEYLR